MNNAIGNDPSLEKLCIERTHAGAGFTVRGEPMPFEIDSRYVAQSRSFDPTVTFVALGDGFTATLVECGNQHSGKFQAFTVAISSNYEWYWHLLPNPKYDPQGRSKAPNRCLAIARTNLRPGFERLSYTGAAGIPRVGTMVAGIKTEPYDIVVIGSAAYPATPDMDVANFTCLFSPSLELKTIEIKPARFKK